jgi:NDP-sugar pyrophosphorylase family protein
VRALLLAAGLGTRLAPLTQRLPKALVPVAGRPALDQVLARLQRAGVRAVGVNLHHHAERLRRHLEERWGAGAADAVKAAGAAEAKALRIQLSIEPEILGPAGGMAGFVDWWRRGDGLPGAGHEPLLLHNADAATDIDLRALWRAHQRRAAELGPGRLALTLALVPHPPTDSVALDSEGRVLALGVRRHPAGEGRLWTYTGVAILGRAWMERLQPGLPAAFVPEAQAAMADGLEVRGWIARGAAWHDLGTPERYLAAHRAILRHGALPRWDGALPARRPGPLDARHGAAARDDDAAGPRDEAGCSQPANIGASGSARPPWRIASSARIGPEVQLRSWGILDRDSRVGRGARLRNVILWPGAEVAPGETLENAIVAPWARVVLGPQS